MSTPPLYQLNGIKRVTDNRKVILAIESLELPRGELTAIVGPNGAGKSTLLKLLAFLEKPDHGSIRFQGRPVTPRDFVQLRRQVTMVDQNPLLFQGTVFKNVTYGLKVRGVPRRQWRDRVAEALSVVDLGDFAHRSVKGLSGGETQRVAIARALVFRPRVILLDEPTAGVDVARIEMVESLIKKLHAAADVSIQFSTHNLSQAYRLTDRVIHLAGGCLVPHSIENLFVGTAAPEDGTGDRSRLMRLPCGTTMRIGSGRTGEIRFYVPAAAVKIEAIDAGEEPVNRFVGTISQMELRGENVWFLLSGRLNLRAEMPPDEYRRLGLALGSRVAAVIPPEAIRVLDADDLSCAGRTAAEGEDRRFAY